MLKVGRHQRQGSDRGTSTQNSWLDRYALIKKPEDPVRKIMVRIAIAVGIILVVALIAYFDRGGYLDVNKGPDYEWTFLDALHYATVTATTTGYGDMVPVTPTSRLISIVVVTPLRVLFLVLLVGTTLETLTTESRRRSRVKAKRKELMHDHILICGYGVKGRSALDYLRKHDDSLQVFVIDTSKRALAEANRDGVEGLRGESFDRAVLREARIEHASKVVISVNSDENSILTVLRARELNPKVKIVVACRREENQDLLKRSGADEVIVSDSSAGRILGMAADAPDAARVLNDLLTFGDGLDIDDREVIEDGEEVAREGQNPIAVVRSVGRDGETKILRPGFDREAKPLRKGDRVVYIATRRDSRLVKIPREYQPGGPVKVSSARQDEVE